MCRKNNKICANFEPMKYIIRALKYFVQLLVMLALFITVLVLLHVIDADLNTMFTGGISSIWKIAAIVAAFAAIYPRFGYTSRRIYLNGSFEELMPLIRKEMEERGYRLEETEGENMKWRLVSPVARFTRMWEDRITMTRTMNGWAVEGSSKDVIRLVNGFMVNDRDQEDE